MNKLWETFNDVAEGFGLNQDETCEICRALQPTLEIHQKGEMDQLTVSLFTALDTDEVGGLNIVPLDCGNALNIPLMGLQSCQNGLVDALEFLGTMAVMSAMTIAQKLTCMSHLYRCIAFALRLWLYPSRILTLPPLNTAASCL